ncbi:MAG: hypothetical protein U9N10_02190 [Bacillota bacterium]|nr:hypothetical protein [Bacillota bacterium]
MITKDTELLEIAEKYPETEKFFHLFDKPLGHCILCENLFDTLENISTLYNLELNLLLDYLNLIAQKTPR